MPLSDIATSKHVSLVLTDPNQPDNPIVDCSKAFLQLTGYARDEVIGRNCRFLAGPATDPDRQKIVRDAINNQQPVVVELLNYRKDGTVFLNSLMIAPTYDEEGILNAFVGMQFEVTQAEEAFVQTREKTARIMAASLSARQRQVLSLLAKGKRFKQIAYELGITERTAKMHRAAMLNALKVGTTAEAVRIAVRAGI